MGTLDTESRKMEKKGFTLSNIFRRMNRYARWNYNGGKNQRQDDEWGRIRKKS
jgi:hypothetical protein